MSWCAVCDKHFDQATNVLPGNVCPSCWYNRPASVAWSARQSGLESERDTLRARLEAAEANVKAWEDKEANRGHCCYLNEERAKKAEARVAGLESEVDHHRTAAANRMLDVKHLIKVNAQHMDERDAAKAEAARLRELLETAHVLVERCVRDHNPHDCTVCEWHRAVKASLEDQDTTSPVCRWTPIQADPNEQQTWQAGCAAEPDARTFEFNQDGPLAQGWTRCPYCGGTLEEAR